MKKLVRKFWKDYRRTPRTGKLFALGIFVTHGLLDALTSSIAFMIASKEGIERENIELNPIIPLDIPSMVLVNITGGIILFALVMYSIKIFKYKAKYSIYWIFVPEFIVLISGFLLIIE
jgi:hypothetical protein